MMKKSVKLTLAGIGFILLAGVLLVIGGVLEGWNFVDFFTSNTAYMCYVVLGVYVLFFIYLTMKDNLF